MLEAIERAELSITIEAYIYWAGEIGLVFAQALAAKAKSGVKVKILLDAVGSASIGDEILKTLESGPCQVAWYNPIRSYTFGRFNHRTHRKSLIIDGRIAFTGGAGIADHWRGNAEDPAHWRDMQVRLEGPAVTPLQTGFAENWLQTTGELISGPLYYPPHAEPAGPYAAQTIMSSPEIGASTVRTMYYLSIICARKSLYIANPYFVPDAGGDRRADRGQAPRRRRADHGVGRAQRQLAGAAEQRPAVRPAARGRHRDPRIQPHACCTTRRWWWTTCGRRSARPTSTTARSRTTKRTTSASTIASWPASCSRHVRRRPRRLRSRRPGAMAPPRRLGEGAGVCRVAVPGADVGRTGRWCKVQADGALVQGAGGRGVRAPCTVHRASCGFTHGWV